MFRRLTIVTGVAIAFLTANVATADASEPRSNPRDEIKAVIKATQIAIANGASATELSEMLYAPDIIEVGEGEPGPKLGMKSAIAEVEAHWASLGPGGHKKCKLRLADYPGLASETTYASFVVLHCEPNPPALMEAQDIRCLYVWKKLPQGWRVVMFQWGIGTL